MMMMMMMMMMTMTIHDITVSKVSQTLIAECHRTYLL